MFKKTLLCVLLGTTAITLSGCQALGTAISHRDLVVQTKMSNSIFLPPVSDAKQQVIYLSVTNTSAQSGLDLRGMIAQNLQQNGWTVTNDISQASRMLQVNVLQAGITTKDASQRELMDGFGSGIATGALVAATGGSPGAAIGGGLAAGIAGTVISAMVQDVVVSVIADVQVSVKVAPGSVTQNTQSTLQQGTQTTTNTTYNNTSEWQPYTTRVVSTADQVNLTVPEAIGPISTQMASSIAGLF